MLRLKAKCKICRRYGEKMFMKGERDLGPKCAHIRRGTRPGMHGKARRRRESEFGQQLAEKQKVRFSYGISNAALRKVFTEALARPEKTSEALGQMLERRLDNAAFRAGFAVSRSVARQAVSHGHILVNQRRVTIPSYRVRRGDIIAIKPQSLGTGVFADLENRWRKHNPPQWLEPDRESHSVKVKDLPREDEVRSGRDLRLVIEYYSK